MSREEHTTYPATLVKYARKAVPDNMTGSYRRVASVQHAHTSTDKTACVSNHHARDQEEHIKVREQPTAGLAALPRDPKRQEPQQPRRIQRDGNICLRKAVNQQQARLESAFSGQIGRAHV